MPPFLIKSQQTDDGGATAKGLHIVATMENTTDRRDLPIVVELPVAPADETLYYRVGNARVLLTHPIMTRFLFDTGAAQTLICRELADQLNLEYSGTRDVRVANDCVTRVLESKIGIKIGGTWRIIPCWVRDSNERNTINCLGMRGLLGPFAFLVMSHGVVFVPRTSLVIADGMFGLPEEAERPSKANLGGSSNG